MKATVNVFPEVKRLYIASHDVHVDFTWQFRTHEWLQHANELSRILDSSEIFLRYMHFERVYKFKHKGVAWGKPTLDVFAGTARDQHQVKRFYTLRYAPECGLLVRCISIGLGMLRCPTNTVCCGYFHPFL